MFDSKTMSDLNNSVMTSMEKYNKGSLNNLLTNSETSSSAIQSPSILVDKKEKLVGRLNSLVQQLERCCKCPDSGPVPQDPNPPSDTDFCVRQEFTTPGWPCQKRPCTPTGPVCFGLKPRAPFKNIPLGGRRSVPHEIDWENYPLITTCATRETRFKSNKADISEAEQTRKDIRICMRPWLPPPVDLGGTNKPWDLKRYPSRELIEGNVVLGCDCRKNNGLQEFCMRSECRGSPACLHEPYPVCKPSGGPGPSALCPEELNPKKRHKNNCWCPECRPPCFPKKTERELQGRCAGCVGRDSPTCGSSCEHYCSKHMAGVKEIEPPPIMC